MMIFLNICVGFFVIYWNNLYKKYCITESFYEAS